MKVGVIVEGDSDKDFFEKYFKPNYKKDIIVLSPGKKGTCKILNKSKVHKDIKALIAKGCEQVCILIDLDTQCDGGTKFNCVVELKDRYVRKVSLDKFPNASLVVVSNEIEAWMLSAWENSNRKMKKDLERKFGSRKSLSEKDMVKRFLGSKMSIDRTNNDSLEYFMSKLGI